MKIKVSDYIAQKLTDKGITQVFTVTGGGAMHLNDALGHNVDLHCIYNHHEQASAMAAEAYARIHNQAAVLCVTTGPGGTNAITGVLGSWLDSIPMLVLSGQVRYDTTARWAGVGIRAMGDQEFDICKAVTCMTKYCEMVIDPQRIRFCLEKALYLLASGRPGPVWLDIPLNVQAAYVDDAELAGFDQADYNLGGTGWGTAVDPPLLEADQKGSGELRQLLPPPVTEELAVTIIRKIMSAERPVLNAGNGIRISGAHALFIEVIKKLGIPVVTGWNSEDCLNGDHPLYTGRAGNLGDRAGNFAIQNSDLVFSVGSRLSIRQVGYNYKGWAREAYTIINDIDIEELKKPSIHVDLAVHADAKDLLAVMNTVLDRMSTPVFEGGTGIDHQSWNQTCQYWKHQYPVVLPKHFKEPEDNGANVYAFIHELAKQAQENQITVVGNGSACVVGGHAYQIKKGQRFITNSAVASMGYDLPAAIGVYQAESKQDVLLVTGDGSIQMNLQELQTIIHHQMAIKIFLLNNGGYHSIRQTQKNFFGEPLVGVGEDSYDLSFPDLRKLAAAYGFPYRLAQHNHQLANVIEETMKLTGPVICEIIVSRDQPFEPKSAAKRLADGTMVSPPLEDLFPFLPPEEMAANMIVKRMKE